MLRLFVALPLPRDITQKLSELTCGLPGARWVPSENYHLTLRFIGEIAHHQADDLDAALSMISEEAVEIKLNGFGHFGKRGRANSLIAMAEKTPSLLHLQKKVERAMIKCGMEPETRKFCPHVTLARMKPTPEVMLHDYAKKHHFPKGLSYTAHQFVLYSSYLSNTGSVYSPEIEYPLNGGLDEDWTQQAAEEFAMDYTYNYRGQFVPEFA
ncbi:RNA 2',3'-cyclic phosphodiesterase [Curvivirga sp.]|uniref:RNA 2',3'-cyclic phosphodiesterase n=1 Tax=Curvivirga sp. TaxID=2856848 RepID=UPI003B5A7FAD